MNEKRSLPDEIIFRSAIPRLVLGRLAESRGQAARFIKGRQQRDQLGEVFDGPLKLSIVLRDRIAFFLTPLLPREQRVVQLAVKCFGDLCIIAVVRGSIVSQVLRDALTQQQTSLQVCGQVFALGLQLGRLLVPEGLNPAAGADRPWRERWQRDKLAGNLVAEASFLGDEVGVVGLLLSDHRA